MRSARACGASLIGYETVCCAYAEPFGQSEERLSVSTRIRSHRPQLALLEQRVLIAEHWDVGQPDAGDCERPAAVERPQRSRHQRTGRSEQDRTIQGLRRHIVGVAHGVCAELGRQLPVGLTPSQDMDPQTLGQRYLRGEMRAAAKAVDAE